MKTKDLSAEIAKGIELYFEQKTIKDIQDREKLASELGRKNKNDCRNTLEYWKCQLKYTYNVLFKDNDSVASKATLTTAMTRAVTCTLYLLINILGTIILSIISISFIIKKHYIMSLFSFLTTILYCLINNKINKEIEKCEKEYLYSFSSLLVSFISLIISIIALIKQ